MSITKSLACSIALFGAGQSTHAFPYSYPNSTSLGPAALRGGEDEEPMRRRFEGGGGDVDMAREARLSANAFGGLKGDRIAVWSVI